LQIWVTTEHVAKFGDDRPNDLPPRLAGEKNKKERKKHMAKYNVGSASYHCRAV